MPETAPFNGAIWDESSEQHLHKSIQKESYVFPISTF